MPRESLHNETNYSNTILRLYLQNNVMDELLQASWGKIGKSYPMHTKAPQLIQ